MKKHLKSLGLAALSLPLIVLGGWRLLEPVSFFAFNGLPLGSDPGVLSEARATGGVVVGFAAVIAVGIFRERSRPRSLLVAAVLFYSFAAARVLSLVADGNPGDQVVQGLISEVVFGTAALIALVKTRRMQG